MIAFAYDARFLEHDMKDHPECAGRLRSIMDYLQDAAISSQLIQVKVSEASEAELALIHNPQYIQSLQDFCKSGDQWIDADTYVLPCSYDIARLAVGAVLNAIKTVHQGLVKKAFCAVRPPGHHAASDMAMGFCLFNNIAIGARFIQKQKWGDKILIIDWDVHHGNGTQDIFWEDPSVGYVSVHRYPFYPGTGRADETGGVAAKGTLFNLPVSARTGIDEILNRTEEMIQKAADQMRPDWILISCGFDAYHKDPLGGLGFDAHSYARLTSFVGSIARCYAEGRVVSVLEGGYNQDALGPLVEAHLQALIM
ncbi:MAG: histone deacetylase [Chlamydiota bacterium]|nr:histone deacetylase [Chlamydiota bacterium]